MTAHYPPAFNINYYYYYYYYYYRCCCY